RIQASEGQFLLKEFQSKYSVDDVKIEPKITYFVRTRGIPAANFIRTIAGEYVWQFRNRAFHLQEFVEGTIFPKNAAPDWLLRNSAILLGQIHRVLLNFPLMKEGFGPEWFSRWDVDESKQRYSILIKAAEQLPRGEKREKILADLHYKIENLSKAACVCIAPDRLTRRNSHGDYHILQLICGVSSVRAIIDFSSACRLPVIFEIIRSYTYADPKCANAQIDVSNLKKYVILYLKNGELNRYDLEMMPYLYYLQLSRSRYGYREYLIDKSENRESLIEFGFWRTNMCRWLEKHAEYLSRELGKLTG
ncbi:MAG: phosphotransferase, partial [Candidatus Poribacteria bacterium]